VTGPSWPPPGAPPPPRSPAGAGYRSPVLITRLTIVAFAVGLLVIAEATAAAIQQVAVATQELAAPGSVAPERLAAVDRWRTVWSRAVLFIDLVGLGLLSLWTRRLYGNLRALGAQDLRFGEGWALGGWFVPFLNLVRPKQIVDDIWRASDPVRRPEEAWDQRPLSNLLHWWWFFWVVLCLPTLLLAPLPALVFGLEAGSVEGADSAGSIVGVCGAGQMLFGLLTIAVVVRTTSRQVRIAAGDRPEPSRQQGGDRFTRNHSPLIADSDDSGEHLRPVHVSTIPIDPPSAGFTKEEL
jgi:hypothetical protein